MSLVDKALEFAVSAHYGQRDKGGKPYILHPIRVMLSLLTLSERTVGILHDTVEDTYITFDILRQLKYPERIIKAIDSVTKRNDEKWIDFVERSSQDSLGIKVKLADIKDNMDPVRMHKLDHSTRNRLHKKYTKALNYLNQIAIKIED